MEDAASDTARARVAILRYSGSPSHCTAKPTAPNRSIELRERRPQPGRHLRNLGETLVPQRRLSHRHVPQRSGPDFPRRGCCRRPGLRIWDGPTTVARMLVRGLLETPGRRAASSARRREAPMSTEIAVRSHVPTVHVLGHAPGKGHPRRPGSRRSARKPALRRPQRIGHEQSSASGDSSTPAACSISTSTMASAIRASSEASRTSPPGAGAPGDRVRS